MIKRQRPIGVKIIIALELFRAFVLLVEILGIRAILFEHNANAIDWLTKTGFLQLEQLRSLQNNHGAFNFFVAIMLLVMFINLVIANELYNLNRWAWMIMLILTGWGLFSNFSVLIHGKLSNNIGLFSIIIGIIINIIIIYCLMIPSTRQAFRKGVKAN